MQDGDTGRIIWRQGKGGFKKDYDGEPIAQNHNYRDMKSKPKHHPHMGHKRKGHKPYMGNRPTHKPKMGE